MAKLSYGCAGLVAVISGGSSGIGLATAEKLLLDGAKVYILGRSRARGEAAVAELAAKTGAQALFLACDVSKEASCICSRLVGHRVPRVKSRGWSRSGTLIF